MTINHAILKRIYCSILLILLSGVSIYAQISPGELSKGHAELEGMAKCTQCHVLGQKVSDDKCLACHKEIKSRVAQGKGYHASKAMKGKSCASCHSDHHGRNFDIIRFDEKQFDHALTGYALTGAHAKTDCRACHKPDFVGDPVLKKKKTTFLGLKESCASCHTDVHQKTLPGDCAKCHTTTAFKPASRFDHNKADFALKGKHVNVDCIECHKKETRNGQEFQNFAGVNFQNCNSCHEDPHKNQLGTACKTCHVEESFTNLSGLPRFNHSSTAFPLKGKHKSLGCAECHALNATPLTIFQDKKGIATSACASCHKDVHEGKLGSNCAECHTEDSFQKVSNLDGFNHALTDFPLEGKHIPVDCKKCHKADYTEPVEHQTCASCHADYHEGQFVRPSGASLDCAVCHRVDGFETTSYTVEMHQQTKFPLTGGHEATPCLACHKKAEQWVFRNLGQRCVDCHEDIHKGEINEKYYPKQECTSCHTTSSWKESKFDHNQTKFLLEGAHQRQACSACHIPDDTHRYGRFAGLPNTCADCHEDQHNGQFKERGVTECSRCHSQDVWKIPRFNHSKTAFVLDGKHAKVACEACHKPVAVGEKMVVQYKFNSFKCADCHK